ncbi:MAG: phosphate acyltransferase [Bradymonadaceae bacterium]
MIGAMEELVELARLKPARQLVLAGANHASTLEAVVQARRRGIIGGAVLVGDSSEVEERLRALGESPEDYALVGCAGDFEVASMAVAIMSGGKGDLLLKGHIPTGALLGAVLTRGAGLRTGRALSDVMITENPVEGGPALLGVADGGVNIAPDLAMKKQIIENAVKVFHRLGVEVPRVALLCAVEKVNGAMPHTVEARQLVEMNRDGIIRGCILGGPLALDNAICLAAAQAKGLDSPVAGRADILIAPNIEAANILGKAFRYLAGKSLAHVIEGARVPILIPSRTESPEDKLYSIALGALCTGEDEP